jgi:DNA helicase-2/ATP-dependent DNA helicase PcrA
LANSIVKITGVIADTFTDRSPEAQSRQENVQELLKAIHEFCETRVTNGEGVTLLPDFLSEVSLLTDQDTDKESDKDKITLMTVHAAKGLEFKAVFIVGMEEELFPSPFCTQSERELEEERRLFYVALTRAEERCFISYAKSRFKNGKTNFSNPSRFIQDIDEQYLEMPLEQKPKQSRFSDWDDELETERNRFQRPFSKPVIRERVELPVSPKRLVKVSAATSNSVPIMNGSIPIGAFVKHSIFGIGKVLETSISNGNEKADIDFGEKGTKSLLLKFAKLEILE